MNLSRIIVMFFSLSMFFGCGVSWQPALTTEEMAKYPTVIALAKDRYTNVRASSGLSQWHESNAHGRSIASFRIATNTTRVAQDKKTFFDDVSGYCQVKKGVFKNLQGENTGRMLELKRKYSYQVEKKNLDDQAMFECGPEGMGTISYDWTKFNPSICRKLYVTNVDMKQVNAEYGKPADYQCETSDGILFMVAMQERFFKNGAISVFIRINDGNGEPIAAKLDRMEMH